MSETVKKLVMVKPATLAAMIDSLPIEAFNNEDLIHLIFKFISETPADKTQGDYASRAKVKLDALRLLHDILKSENKSQATDELIDILKRESDDEE
jgi:hypothetical protein